MGYSLNEWRQNKIDQFTDLYQRMTDHCRHYILVTRLAVVFYFYLLSLN